MAASPHHTRAMKAKQRQKEKPVDRGILARPLDALAFLLPLIVFYETVSRLHGQDRVIAFDLLRRFFELFGHFGIWAPGLGVMAILVATHMVSGEKWKVHWGTVGRMYPEACLLALPLLSLNWVAPLAGAGGETTEMIDRIAMGVGAGVYEELVFRLVLISVVVMLGADLLRIDRSVVAIGAIVLSSLLFAAHHYQPIGVEQFDVTSFTFRAIAGAYLAAIFWLRGYGPAAGCHAAYNVVLVFIESP